MEKRLQKESELLTQLVVSCLTGRKVSQESLGGVNIKMLYKLAKFHELHNLTGYAIRQNGLEISEEYYTLFENAKEAGMCCTASQMAAAEIVKEALIKNRVHHILLKGIVIRALYPSEDMRTSGDVDILYNENDIDENALELVMKELGFEKTKGSDTVDTFSSGLSVFEMHRKLSPKENDGFIPQHMLHLFDGATDEQYEMKLSGEDFYVYHISHMAKHFCAHGCGIRPLADMYLWLKKYGGELDRKVVDEHLAETGLCEFERNARELVDGIFNGTELSDVQKEMYNTMMFSGIYGNLSRSAANERVKSKNGEGGKLKSLAKTALLPLANMKVRYPILKKAPVLLPVMWGVRVFDVFIHKSDKIKDTVARYNGVDEDEINRTIELYKSLGLSK